MEQPRNLIESVEHLEAIVVQCLEKASTVHDSLGEAGEEEVEKNQFGEKALKADIECEDAVFSLLETERIPIQVISEEHGQVDVGQNPRFLGILDGLDGSGVYKKERGIGRYATMFGIFSTTNPTYNDYLVSGIMEHSTKRLYIARKQGGAFVIKDGKRIPIHTSGQTKLQPSVNIYIDDYFEICRATFVEKLEEFRPASGKFSTGSSAIAYVDTAQGVADLTLECTRKSNLEIAIMYGLIKEAGGAVVELSGISIGDKKYREFGQNEQLPVITAATKELADALIDFLKKSKDVK